MAIEKRCMSCMCGTIINGVCSYCHRQEKDTNVNLNALPVKMLLHKRYYIGNVLGRGGFGLTYAAWDTKENKRVVIKELYPSHDVSRESDYHTVKIRQGQEKYFSRICECFEKEAKMLMMLQNHEGVICLYHLFSDNNTVYYSMEYLDGMDLKGFLGKRGKMQWEELLPIVKIILKALDNLHTQGLIHRDISPDNIFILRDGGVRLIDFGSVRMYQGNDHFTVFLKQNFAPWEQYKADGRQGPWTDIYAFCVTLYYSLSGELPPMAPDRIMKDKVIPLKRLCPGLPVQVAAAIMKGMSVRIEKRLKSARELAAMMFPGENIFSQGDERKQKVLHNTNMNLHIGLVCCSGYYKGHRFELSCGCNYKIGRRPDCEIRYPDRFPQVSRVQCTVYMDREGNVLVRDEKSSYGTYISYNQKIICLEPFKWYMLSGSELFFGERKILYSVRIKDADISKWLYRYRKL